jgi:hypothetical protein
MQRADAIPDTQCTAGSRRSNGRNEEAKVGYFSQNSSDIDLGFILSITIPNELLQDFAVIVLTWLLGWVAVTLVRAVGARLTGPTFENVSAVRALSRQPRYPL